MAEPTNEELLDALTAASLARGVAECTGSYADVVAAEAAEAVARAAVAAKLAGFGPPAVGETVTITIPLVLVLHARSRAAIHNGSRETAAALGDAVATLVGAVDRAVGR